MLNKEKDKNKKFDFDDNNNDYNNIQNNDEKKSNFCVQLLKDYLPFTIVIAILMLYFVTFYWDIDSHGYYYY